MPVIADNKKRVPLPTKPGERFDLQSVGRDKFVLTRPKWAELNSGSIFSERAPYGDSSSRTLKLANTWLRRPVAARCCVAS
jgi:hypothetical protein